MRRQAAGSRPLSAAADTEGEIAVLIAFIAANAILAGTLALTIFLSSMLPPILLDIIHLEWLANIGAGAIVGAAIGRAYDVLIPAVSGRLRDPITPNTFSVASVLVVVLIVLAALGTTLPALQNPQNSPEMMYFAFGVVGFGTFESWRHLPQSIPLLPRLVIAMTLGGVLFVLAFLAPAIVITQFVNNYNAGFAVCLAGWAGGLTSRQLRLHFGHGSLDERAGGVTVESIVGREFAVLLAVIVTYVGFKLGGGSPVLFSVTVGVVGSAITGVMAMSFFNER